MFAFTFIFALYTFSVHTTLGIIPVTDNVVEQNIAFLAVEYWPCLLTSLLLSIAHVYWLPCCWVLTMFIDFFAVGYWQCLLTSLLLSIDHVYWLHCCWVLIMFIDFLAVEYWPYLLIIDFLAVESWPCFLTSLLLSIDHVYWLACCWVLTMFFYFLAVEYWPCLMTIFIDHVYWDIVLSFRLRYLCWSGYCGNINTCVYEFVVLQINICSTGWLTANTCILNNWLMSMCLALFCHSICVIITKWVFTNVCFFTRHY